MRFFEQFPEIIAATSEVSDNPMGSSTNHGPEGEYAENRARFLAGLGIDPDRLVMAGIVLGRNVRVVSSVPDSHRVPDCDALITQSPEVTLAIAHADCLPLFCYEPRTGAVGIIHAGWQGILGGIIEQTVEALRDHGVAAARTLVAIGPGIRFSCFAVRDDERGIRNFREAGYGRDPFATEVPNDADEYFVDLPLIVRDQLTRAGVLEENITASLECTKCTSRDDRSPRFFSWRRERVKGQNMLSVIQRARRRDPNEIFL